MSATVDPASGHVHHEPMATSALTPVHVATGEKDVEKDLNVPSRTSAAELDLAEKGVVTPPSPVDVNVDGTEPAVAETTSPRKVKGIVWALVVLAILSSTFLFALDNLVIATLQPVLIEKFGEIEKLPWLSVAFLLGALSTNLVWGKIYGQFNAKYLYLISITLFEVGSAVCGAAKSMNTLIVARAIAGVGGSGLYIGVLTLLSVTTSIQERPFYIGLTGLTWGIGTVLGPIVGGGFSDSSATWRWAFYINLVIGGVFVPVYIFLLPTHDPRPNTAFKKRLVELDYVGTITIIGAFTAGVMAISFGGSVYAWNSGRIIGLFVCSGVLFILFGLQQTFSVLTTPARRIFPIQFLKRRTMLILFAMVASATTIMFMPIYFIPLYFQFVRNDTALKAGVRLLPLVCFLVLGSVLNGSVMSKYGLYWPWYVFGGVLGLVGGALMHSVNLHTTAGQVYGYTILLGLGGGAFVQASFAVAQAKVQEHEIPLAVGFITCGQIGGSTIALAIANAIFLNQSTQKITQLLPHVPIGTVRGAIAGSGSSFFNTLAPDTRTKVLVIIVDAISRAYILIITAGALVLVLSVFMRRERLFMQMGAAA
ncbi:MAG: hypothetical protein M1826_005160 [Phylliscum demangeonii]|nr:MAG: hypothetical protein M1826_005160 [Phylliscum demangeonii]